MLKRTPTQVIFIFLLFFCSIAGYNLEASNCDSDCLKEFRTVSHLARRCKSQWDGQGCAPSDRIKLVSYILYSCGDMPVNTHHMNRQYFEKYISDPMLNTAFLIVWHLLNPVDVSWPICVVCLLDYPLDPYWEQNFSYCKN